MGQKRTVVILTHGHPLHGGARQRSAISSGDRPARYRSFLEALAHPEDPGFRRMYLQGLPRLMLGMAPSCRDSRPRHLMKA